MARIRVGPAKLVGEGTMKEVAEEGKTLLIANISGSLYSIGGICTHMGCHLSQGRLEGQNVICPCHGSTFDVKTGNVVKGPARRSEPSYRITVEDGEVSIELP